MTGTFQRHAITHRGPCELHEDVCGAGQQRGTLDDVPDGDVRRRSSAARCSR